MKPKVVLETNDKGGHTVYAPTLPTCISEGDTKDDVFAHAGKLTRYGP